MVCPAAVRAVWSHITLGKNERRELVDTVTVEPVLLLFTVCEHLDLDYPRKRVAHHCSRAYPQIPNSEYVFELVVPRFEDWRALAVFEVLKLGAQVLTAAGPDHWLTGRESTC